MTADPLLDALAAVGTRMLPWVLTYLLHSTLVLGAVGLAARWRSLPVPWQAALWKGALFGAVLTATSQTPFGLDPLTGEFHLDVGASGRQTAVAAAAATAETRANATPSAPPEHGEYESAASVAAPVPSRLGPASNPDELDASNGEGHGPWAALGALLWISIAGGLLVRSLLRHRRFFRALRRRRPAEEPVARRAVERLADRAGVRRVRLTVSDALPAPAVLGTREVCVPKWFLSDLDWCGQESALAHEIGHMVHRDPQWNLASTLLTGLLFFQPLNWLAARRIRETAEYLADDWAVGQGCAGLDLARCLSEVASRYVSTGLRRIPGTAAIVERDSALVDRTRRLLQGTGTNPPAARGAYLAGVGTLMAAIMMGLPALELEPEHPAGGIETRDPDAAGRQLGSEPPARWGEAPPPPRPSSMTAPPNAETGEPVGREPVSRLEGWLKEAHDPEVVQRVAGELVERHPRRAVEVFLEVIKERPRTAARTVSIHGLRELPDSIALPALDDVARRHPDPSVREEAAEWAAAKRARAR